MSRELAVIEEHLGALKPRFETLLPTKYLPSQRLVETVLVACDRNPYLMQCQLPTLLSAAMSAAVLGLEPDGVLGQAALVPFKGKIQFLPMVGGYCTLAGRSGRTLEGHVVYDGDHFEFNEGEGWVDHRWKLGAAKRGDESRVLGAYAISRAVGAPPMIKVMQTDEILAVRARSAGYRTYKQKGTSTPWVTDPIPMFEKTPMRMLAKRIPLITLHMAGALDMHHDLGHHAYLNEKKVLHVDGHPEPIEGEFERSNGARNQGAEMAEKDGDREWLLVMPNGTVRSFPTETEWANAMVYLLEKNAGKPSINKLWADNEAVFGELSREQLRQKVTEAHELARPAF